MKKTSIVVKEKDSLKIDIIINNTGYIESVTGKTGLLNIKTNKLIGEMDNYYTIYDREGEFYYQEKTIEKSSEENNWNSRKILRIYDAKEEKILVDGWEVVKTFSNQYQLSAVRSPIDGKIHLFDRYACRKDTNIFAMALDDVELLYSRYDTYLVVTINGKKGIYRQDCSGKMSSLITPIEFDNIQKLLNIIVYTKDAKKYFVYDNKDGKTSLKFDEIVLDEKHKNIVYCKKDSRTYVYNTNLQELLLNEECDDIKYLCFRGKNEYDHRYGKFYFIITKNNLKGLLEVETIYSNTEVIAGKALLLPVNYDDIEYSYGVFYPKKDGKTGLFKQGYKQNVFVEVNYDKITDLGCSMYAIYYGDRCDVYKIENELDRLIKNCKLISLQRQGCIFEQNNSYGILYQGLKKDYSCYKDVIVDNYDNVSYLGDGYYEVERNGKKGVNFQSQDIISIEYDTIDMKLYEKKRMEETVYFALGKKDLGFELAKKRHWEYSDSDVEFTNSQKFEEINLFEDIMTLRTKTNLLIYDYEEKLLKKLPASSQISMIYRKPDRSYDKKTIYVVDENFYYYKDGKFEEMFIEENDLYITTYETETDSFEIKTFDKIEHDSFCEIIDSQEDSVAEQSLIDVFENNRNEVRQHHRTLVLKRTPKNN